MRLIRNTTPDGSCKYALVRLDKVRLMPEAQRVAILRQLETLKGAGVLELASKDDPEECFVMKLKDENTAPALFAYAQACRDSDFELSHDVFLLAAKSTSMPNRHQPT